MNKEQIEKVEKHIKENLISNKTIESIMTISNPQKIHNAPKYLTQLVVIVNEKAGLKVPVTFNSLKILRELEKREKYGKN